MFLSLAIAGWLLSESGLSWFIGLGMACSVFAHLAAATIHSQFVRVGSVMLQVRPIRRSAIKDKRHQTFFSSPSSHPCSVVCVLCTRVCKCLIVVFHLQHARRVLVRKERELLLPCLSLTIWFSRRGTKEGGIQSQMAALHELKAKRARAKAARAKARIADLSVEDAVQVGK
jgi:hypothetical protein